VTLDKQLEKVPQVMTKSVVDNLVVKVFKLNDVPVTFAITAGNTL
jgi:hypothetical protein